MSSTNKTTNYQLSQFVGTDIPSILNDYNGDMRKIDNANHDARVAGGDNATAIAELQATTNRISTEVGGINSTVNSLSGRVLGIEDKIPANASAENKLITAEDIPEIPSIAELQEQVDDMGGDVKAIQLCVPSSASENNKLITKEQSGYTHRYFSVNSGVTYKQALESAIASITDFNSKINDIQIELLISGENGVLCQGTLYFNQGFVIQGSENPKVFAGVFVPKDVSAVNQKYTLICYYSQGNITKLLRHTDYYQGSSPSLSELTDIKSEIYVGGSFEIHVPNRPV